MRCLLILFLCWHTQLYSQGDLLTKTRDYIDVALDGYHVVGAEDTVRIRVFEILKDNAYKDTLYSGELYFLLSIVHASEGVCDSALLYYNKGNEVLKNNILYNPTVLVQAQLYQGDCYLRYDDTENVRLILNDLNSLYTNSRNNISEYNLPGEFLGKINRLEGNTYLKEGNYNKALESYFHAKEVFTQHEKQPSYNLAKIHSNIALAYSNIYRDDLSIDHMEKSMELSKQFDWLSNAELTGNYLNYGRALGEMKNFSKSDYYLNMSIELANKNKRFNTIGSAYLNKTYNSLQQGLKKESLEYAYSAIEFYTKHSKKNSNLILAYNNLAAALDLNDSLVMASKAIDTCLIHCSNFINESHPYYVSSLSSKFVLLYRSDKYEEALDVLENAIRIGKLNYKNQNVIMTRLYIQHARLYMEMGDFPSAFNSLSLAEETLNIESYSDFSECNSIYGEFFIDYYLCKYRLYESKYRKSNDITDLKIAHENFEKAFEVYNYIRMFYYEDLFLTKLNSDAQSNLEEGTMDCLELFKRTDDPLYLEKALNYIELSKAFTINSYFNLQDAFNDNKIPKEVIIKEKEVFGKLNQLANDIYNEKLSASANDSLIQQMTAELDSLKLVNIKRLENIKENHPDYYYLKYKNRPVSISSIKETIIQRYDCNVINFLETEDKIVTILLSEGKDHFWVTDKPDNFDELISSFNESLLNRTSIKDFKNKSYELYQLLFQEIDQVLNKKDIIIIPSKSLSLINFEILYDRQDELYQVEKYSFFPNYSLSTLMYNVEKNMDISSHVSFFPLYQNKDVSLDFGYNPDSVLMKIYNGDYPILNTSESESLLKKLKGDLYLGMNASKDNFLNSFDNKDIILLSGHSIYNEHNPLLSSFLFSPKHEEVEENILHLSDIYGMNFNSKLVMMSSCSTAKGNYKIGDGIINYAHAFSNAGVPIVGLAHWNIPAQASSEMLNKFYSRIGEDIKLNEILREEKLNMLNNPSVIEYAHPYYWAGITLYGPPTQLTIKNNPFNLKYVFLFLALIISFFLIRKKIVS